MVLYPFAMLPDGTHAAERRLYDDTLDRAMRLTSRHLPWDEALEVAHDVASRLVRRAVEDAPDGTRYEITPALIVRAVNNRLRSGWRDARRRTAAEDVHRQERVDFAQRWAQPGSEMEIRELEELLAAIVASMPPSMQSVFTLVRMDGLSYRAAAHQLGVQVGTVHTQLSRANALLRQAVREFQASDDTNHAAGPQTKR